MLIIGAKGFAKEILEIIHQNGDTKELCFYDDINKDNPEKLYDRFPILNELSVVKKHFLNISPNFILGIGGPKNRKMLYEKFLNLGGKGISLISKNAEIGSFENTIGLAVVICSGVIITNSIKVGKGSLINLNTTIGHDTIIGDFVEICPNVSVSGNCIIGECTFIGTGAILLPNIKIGKNTVVAAGSVVCNDFPDNVMVAGAPAIIKKYYV